MNLLSTLCLFVTAWFHDPAIAADIRKLSGTFRERIAAHNRLEKRGWQATPLLKQALETKGVELEVVVRARKLCEGYDQWYFNPLPCGKNRLPWIDTVSPWRYPRAEPVEEWRELASILGFADAEFVAQHYLGTLTSYGGHPDWQGYRDATGIMVRDLFRAGWNRQRIIRLLNQMQVREETFGKDSF